MTAPVLPFYERAMELRRKPFRGFSSPPLKVYSPRLRRDQIKALYYLKRLQGRPMTALVQEAVDQYLEPFGGVEGVIARGVGEVADAGEEVPRRFGGR